MRPEQIFITRAARFWSQARPYISDVIRSGFPVVVLLLYLAFIAYYSQWIESLPESFPAEWITVPVLGFLLAYSPIRTFLQPPDVIFLLPAEKRMGSYFRRSRIYSMVLQGSRLLVAALILWPLYLHHQGDQAPSLLWYVVVLLLLKWVQIQAAWRESRMSVASRRRWCAVIRWLLTFGLVWLLQVCPFVQASFPAIFALLFYWACIRFFAALTVNWQHLIQLEQRHHSRVYAIFGWFVDVPFRAIRYRRRRWIVWIGQSGKFVPSRSYGYLYWRTFIRSDLPGVVLRLTVFASLTIIWVPGHLFKAICFVAFTHFIGLQLSSLERYHRYLFWMDIYPVARPLREQALIRLTLRLHLAFILLLFIPLSLVLKLSPFSLGWLAISVAWACLSSYRMFKKSRVE